MILKKSFLFLIVLVFSACGGSTSSSSVTSILSPNLTDKTATTLTNGDVVNLTFSNSGGSVTSCTVSPTLPMGLSLSSDCSIVGTPTTDQSTISYIITGTNTAGSDTTNIDLEVITLSTQTVTLSGTITYDSVPFKSGGNSGLDYSNIIQEKVRGAVVEIVNSSGTVLGTTSTDASGAYSITITGTTAKVRVSAQLYKIVSSGQSSWDFQVKDNTSSNALYVMEGSLVYIGTSSTQTRNLNAASGWGGSSYTSTRVAAPFAILDVVYQAVDKITTAQSDALFGSLDIFWSENNIASSGTKSTGQITTSHYDGTALYLLGAENSDTDEYDTAVVGHEWGHYYEDKFSRSDSIGGSHGGGDILDIRIAFGEGFGTALGCMIIDSHLYLDSSGSSQGSTGVFSNLEDGGSNSNPGWYSEASIYSIIYDVFDSTDDTGDTLSLGFSPIHNLFIGAQKNTEAFTSIFTFITALKAENTGNDTEIDAITSNENIASITDIYGTGRTNRLSANANPLYTDLSVGGSGSIVTNYSATSSSTANKLGAYNFIKFTITTAGSYTINITQSGGSNLNPNMYLYTGSSSESIATATAATTGSESLTTTLSVGTYRMAVIAYSGNNVSTSSTTFNITLN